MVLSLELQSYAENIWRRFPEEFISLGAPTLENDFDMDEPGVWCHRVVDTASERLVEIKLPRRTSYLDRDSASDLDDEDGEGNFLQSESDGDDARKSLYREHQLKVRSRLQNIKSQVAQLSFHLHERVSREVRSQLRGEAGESSGRMGPLQLEPLPLKRRPCGSGAEVCDSSVSSEKGEVSSVSPTSSVTSLAARRGLHFPTMCAASKRGSGQSNPESVRRMPHLDRFGSQDKLPDLDFAHLDRSPTRSEPLETLDEDRPSFGASSTSEHSEDRVRPGRGITQASSTAVAGRTQGAQPSRLRGLFPLAADAGPGEAVTKSERARPRLRQNRTRQGQGQPQSWPIPPSCLARVL